MSDTEDDSNATSSDEEVPADQKNTNANKLLVNYEDKAQKGTGEAADGDEDQASDAIPGQKLQAKWDQMYERLLAFRAEHGHCLVPNRYAGDPQLGSWGKSYYS